MKYVQEKNGVFIRQIIDTKPTRWDKNTFCFAYRLTPELAEKFGVRKLKIVTPPYFDPSHQRRREVDPIFVNGEWLQTYVVEELSTDELSELRSIEAAKVREQRNKLLQESDWTQLSDVSEIIKEAWRQYRKDLRDVSLQNNFPFDIVWPTTPNHT